MQLSLRCLYEPELAGGAGRAKCEVFPIRLHTFGTHELRRDRPSTAILFPPDLADAEHRPLASRRQDFEFESVIEWRGVEREDQLWAPFRDAGAYTFAQVGRKFEPNKLSRSVRVVFNAYCRTLNPEKQTCWVRAGSTSFNIDQIRAALNGFQVCCAMVQNAIDVDPRARKSNDVVRVDTPLIKGKVTILKAQLIGGTIDDFERLFLPPQPGFDMETNAQLRQSSLVTNAIINRHMDMFFTDRGLLTRPSIAPLLRFHAPVSLRDQVLMPSMGMVMNRSQSPPPLRFYIDAVRTVCARRGIEPARLASVADAMFGAAALPKRSEMYAFYSFCGALFSLLANSFAYVEDFANKNKAGTPWSDANVEGDEDNKIARTERADDCEGLALEIFMVAMALYTDGDQVLAERTEFAAEYKLLTFVVRLLRLYVFGQMFGAVTNAKMTYGAEITADQTLAHTYSAMIPFDKFVRMLGDATRDKLGKTKRYREYESAETQRLLARLDPPLIIGEGTAIIESVMQPVDLCYDSTDRQGFAEGTAAAEFKTRMSDQVHSRIDLVRLQTEMPFPGRLAQDLVDARRDLSGFYKWVNGFVTSVFAEARMIDFAFLYRQNDGSLTYGVRFNDFLLVDKSLHRSSKRHTIGLMPTIEMSHYEVAVIDNILALDEAVPNVLPGDSSAIRRLPSVDRLARSGPSANAGEIAIHKKRVLVTGRIEDIGPREVAALEQISSLPEWTNITVNWTSVARVDLPFVEPIDIVDVVFSQ